MVMTLLDAEKVKFRLAFRGYAREDVERFRADAITTLEQQIALIQELTAKVGTLEKDVQRYRDGEELLKSSMVLAQRTCDELIAAAHKEADAIKHEARNEGVALQQQFAELRVQREQFEYAFHGLLTGFTSRLEQGNPQLVAKQTAQPELAEADSAIEPQPTIEQIATVADDPIIEPAPLVSDKPPLIPQCDIPPVQSPPAPAPVPSVPQVKPSASSAHVAEIDRDVDIASFTAAIDDASDTDSAAWPECDVPTTTDE